MEKTINIFGDSITWGAGDSEMGGWANRLRLHLEKRQQYYFEVYNLGICGDDSNGLAKRFQLENEMRDPSMIIVAIGTNDASFFASKNDNRVTLRDFEDNLESIIKEGRKYTDKIVFVGLTMPNETELTPTPWISDIYYRETDAKIYDQKIKEICKKNNLGFIEMMYLLDERDLEDGLHPNSGGHEKMFMRIKDFLENNNLV